MSVLSYYIDPLLDDLPSVTARSFLELLPDLAVSMPQHTHIALSAQPGTEAEPHERLKLQLLQMPRFTVGSRQSAFSASLRKWLAATGVNCWITTDPAAVQELPGVKSILICPAEKLLPQQQQKSLLFSRQYRQWMSAACILVPSVPEQQALLKQYPVLQGRVRVWIPALQEPVQPLDWGSKEHVKIRYSGGRDYFLYAGEISKSQQLITLLKAYSLVKKWLMTGMPLVIAGPSSEWTPHLEKLLTTYKYRSDVSVYPDLAESEMKELVAGAYALAWPSLTTRDAYPLEWAFASETPVVASGNDILRAHCGEAAQYFPPGDIDALAHSLMVLYKDEHLRNTLIEKGKQLSLILNRERSLENLKALLLELCG